MTQQATTPPWRSILDPIGKPSSRVNVPNGSAGKELGLLPVPGVGWLIRVGLPTLRGTYAVHSSGTDIASAAYLILIGALVFCFPVSPGARKLISAFP